MSLSLLRVVGRRLMNAVPILLITLAVAFWLIQLAPGDVYSEYALNPDIRADDLERFRANFGLDQPWYVQFGRYLWNAAQGDFGFSQTFKAPVFVLVKQRAANTLLLSVVSLLLAWGFSIPAGIIAAARQYRWQDQSIAVLAFFGLSIPNFFLAAVLLYVISATGSWLPIGGMTSIDHDQLSTFGKIVGPGQAPGGAGAGDLHGDHRVADAHHARQHAGGAGPAVHHHRPREGAGGAGGDPQARAAQRGQPDDHPAGGSASETSWGGSALVEIVHRLARAGQADPVGAPQPGPVPGVRAA